MIWIVLGTAAIVTAVVVAGLVIDRKVPLLPRAELATPAPPLARQPPLVPGETAATAVKVPATWRDRIAAGKCACGQPLAVASDEAIRLGDRPLVVVRLTCAACGHARSVYLEPAAAAA